LHKFFFTTIKFILNFQIFMNIKIVDVNKFSNI
jgi:hypothetical protein